MSKTTTYIIGGVPRSGKTVLQDYILKKHKISGISTDLLRDGLEIGVPEFGITKNQNDLERSHILWPYFKGILLERVNYKNKLVIEGANFLPSYLNELKELKYIKVCFLGYHSTSVEDKFKSIQNESSADDDWTQDLTDTELKDDIKNWIKVSKFYKSECKKYRIKYFDTSKDFSKAIELAVNFLID